MRHRGRERSYSPRRHGRSRSPRDRKRAGVEDRCSKQSSLNTPVYPLLKKED